MNYPDILVLQELSVAQFYKLLKKGYYLQVHYLLFSLPQMRMDSFLSLVPPKVSQQHTGVAIAHATKNR